MTVEEAKERLQEYISCGVVQEIYLADEAYALGQEIEQHREGVIVAGFEELFGALLLSLSDRQTLSITKMFDKPSKKYPTRSIPAILDILRTNAELWDIPHRDVLHRELIGAGAGSQSVERLSNAELSHAIADHYECTLTKLDPTLADLRQVRDKVIAHNEALIRSDLPALAWKAAMPLVKYAEDFVSTIGLGYLNLDFRDDGGDYRLARDARDTSKKLRQLLEMANIARSR